jgi:hypothetical protein
VSSEFFFAAIWLMVPLWDVGQQHVPEEGTRIYLIETYSV